MGDDEDRLVPAELGAVWVLGLRNRPTDDKTELERCAALIRKWASRGKIRQHGSAGRAKLYSLSELEQHVKSQRPLTS